MLFASFFPGRAVHKDLSGNDIDKTMEAMKIRDEHRQDFKKNLAELSLGVFHVIQPAGFAAATAFHWGNKFVLTNAHVIHAANMQGAQLELPMWARDGSADESDKLYTSLELDDEDVCAMSFEAPRSMVPTPQASNFTLARYVEVSSVLAQWPWFGTPQEQSLGLLGRHFFAGILKKCASNSAA
ncbi:Hypothetical Protein FCC1311_096692 [Hondaea fermentalgiana]|uniref:Serine protease n=1 Tax=Hondaea fermentalgiana TaxID=2315210 RepID=A0A2R5GRD5_9STRA|nr:Hypothetical Protein FCC1311_096692 [Hondaea fermentalgiana]|eukprot:GBG33446.1 Hypothetical Protein FCC1311_096692 [Hondaea fermentalgiana]